MQSQPPPPSDKDTVVTHTHPPTAVIAETANRFVCPGVVVATVAVIEVTQAAFAHFSRQAAVPVSTALVVVAAIGILEYQVSATLHSARDLWRAMCRVCLLEHASH